MDKQAVIRAGRESVLAFRLQQHHLNHRLPSGALLEGAKLCGIRNSPPGSAELSFAVRLTDFSNNQLKNALATKTLIESWAMRASPYFFPVDEAYIFTQGLLPPNEESLRYYLKTSLPTLEQANLSASAALDLTVTAMLKVLDGRNLTKGELSTEVSQNVPEKMLFYCNPCGAYHVNETLFRLAAQKAGICFSVRTESEAYFMRSDQWLGYVQQPEIAPEKAQKELLRHYLHGYGPSNPRDFALWGGISPKQAQGIWRLVEAELVEIEVEGEKNWLLLEDLPVFQSPKPSEGVRLLPPYDPYLMLSDRLTLFPDKKMHSQVWRALGNPGVLLVEGEAVGLWRPQKKGKRLLLNIELLRSLTDKLRVKIEEEAFGVATLRGCSSFEVKFTA